MQKCSGAWMAQIMFYVLVACVVVAGFTAVALKTARTKDIAAAKTLKALIEASVTSPEIRIDPDMAEPGRTMRRIVSAMHVFRSRSADTAPWEYPTVSDILDKSRIPEAFEARKPESKPLLEAIAASNVKEFILLTDKQQDLTAIALGTKPAPEITVPPTRSLWDWRIWATAYGAFWTLTVAAIALFGHLKVETFSFVRSIKWSQFGSWFTMFVTLPAFMIIWAWVLAFMMADWDVARTIRGVRRGIGTAVGGTTAVALHAGYRLRLLRQMPAPVVHPDVVAALAIRSVTSSEAGNSLVSTNTAKRWVTVEPNSVLGKRHLLRAAGISCYPLTLSSPVKMQTLAIDETDFHAAQAILKIASGKLQATDVSKTRFAQDFRTTGKIVLTVRSDCEDGIRNVLDAASLQAGGIALTFRDKGWESAAEPEEGVIVISVRATTGNATSFVSAETESNVVPIRGLRGVRPGPRGYVLRDERGHALAQITSGNIVILHDYLESTGATDEVCETLARILHESLEMHRLLASLTPAERTSREANSGDNGRQQFVDARLSELRKEERHLAEEVGICDDALANASASILAGTRSRQDLLDRLATFADTGAARERERLGQEYDRLTAMSQVVGVEVGEGCITVETQELTVTHQGETYLVGRFTVEMYENGAVRIHDAGSNKESSNGGTHPHVNKEDVPCLGNITEPLAKLAARREYVAEFTLLLRFLSTWNPNDTRAPRISEWPRVDSAEHAARERVPKRSGTPEDREKYVEACVHRVAVAETSMNEEIAAIEAEMQRLQEDIVSATRKREEARRGLATLRDGRIERRGAIADRSFETLLANPMIASINGYADRVEAFTRPYAITAEGLGERYLGRLRIEVRDDGKVRVSSAEAEAPCEHPHPNVSKAGNPRFSEMAPEIAARQSEDDVGAAVGLVCRFLGSWNPDDRWLTPLDAWPLTKEGSK